MIDQLLTYGMFVFGMNRLNYQELERRTSWKHGKGARYMARDAGQYLGPGDQTITINGMLVPEIAGTYGDIERLLEMGDTGDVYPLILGTGLILGEFRMLGLDDRWRHIIAGGLPRIVDFAVDLERADD